MKIKQMIEDAKREKETGKSTSYMTPYGWKSIGRIVLDATQIVCEACEGEQCITCPVLEIADEMWWLEEA